MAFERCLVGLACATKHNSSTSLQCPRGYKAVDLKSKGPRFDSRGTPEGFSHTGQKKVFGLS
eukprot:2016761-Prymnesium_polylepis.1